MTAQAIFNDHLGLDNIGVNTHAQIDTHIANATLHFTEGSINHTSISNIGVNTHSQIDTHIADGTIHFTEGSIDHGSIGGLTDDDHSQYLLLAGRSGGQTAIGSTVAGERLTLQGSSAGGDVGFVDINSPLQLNYDTFSDAEQFAMVWDPASAVSGTYVGGCLQTAANFTVTTGVFIPAIFSDTNQYNIGATPGFSAITFINELSVVRNSGNFNLPSALVMNIGLVHERNTSGTSTTAGTTGISFSPQTRATVSGAIITKTSQTAVSCRPSFSTVSGATANLGVITGLDFFAPAVALFQPGTGIESATSMIGLRMRANTFGALTREAVRCELSSAGGNYCIRNLSGAQSEFGGGNLFNCGFVQILADNTSLSLGAAGGDVQINWNGSALEFDPLIGDDMRISFATDLHTIASASTSEDSAINFNYPKGAFGEGGTPGNNKYRFVANAETITLAGEFSQFLLTQAANDTIDAALGGYFGWTINAPSPSLGIGSLTTIAALNVGGNPGTATVNRVGVRIISNPSGGSGVNAALWVTAGNTQLDGTLTHTGTLAGLFGATPAAQSAAYTPTNVTTDRSYDANSTTLDELADIVGTLIGDLQTLGAIG